MADTLEDFLKKYEGCHVLLNGVLTELLSYDGGADLLRFFSQATGAVNLRPTPKNMERVTHKFPPRGLYNINGVGVLFTRIPNRQWKRGPCSKNAGFHHLLPAFEQVYAPPEVTHETMMQLLDPVYYTLDEALNTRNLFALALSLDFGVSLPNDNSYDALLFYKTAAIGTITAKTRTITLFNNDFREEVADYLRTHERGVWNLSMAK